MIQPQRHLLTINFLLSPNMTWVFGWPLELERAIEYAKERKLHLTQAPMDETQLYLAAAMHIMQKLYLYDWPLKACWDGKRIKSVFALCIDRKASTAEEAKVRMSRMPPYETALKLAAVLQAEDGPKWYRYDDGTYTPRKGELYPPKEFEDSDDSDNSSSSDDSNNSDGSGDSDPESSGESHDATRRVPVVSLSDEAETELGMRMEESSRGVAGMSAHDIRLD